MRVRDLYIILGGLLAPRRPEWKARKMVKVNMVPTDSKIDLPLCPYTFTNLL
jgi:hypothetical protein